METSPLPIPDSDSWAERLAASLHAERHRVGEFLAIQQKGWEQAEAFIEQELQRLEAELQQQRDHSEMLSISRDALADRLKQTESQLAEAEKRLVELPDGATRHVADEDLQRRYALALDDIRQLKNKNSELQQQIVSVRSTAAKLTQQSRQPGWLDWEAEKRRILAALEAEIDGGEKPQQGERLKLAEVLRTTDEVVAAKNREIQELKQRLDGPPDKESSQTPDTAALEEALNTDTLVREERERLKHLQDEWRQKLLQAEVEIALERAKIARQRAELEERRAAGKAAEAPPGADDNSTEQAEQSSHGRWLSRLGLTNADRPAGRHL